MHVNYVYTWGKILKYILFYLKAAVATHGFWPSLTKSIHLYVVDYDEEKIPSFLFSVFFLYEAENRGGATWCRK
jgi:hypothetical protein